MLILFILCAVGSVWGQNGPTVNISQGSVTGMRALDGNYNIYYGIPYAGSVSAVNRFKAPTPPQNFSGTFMATNPSTVCAQPSNDGFRGVEDCLVLDIHTNATAATNSPVMVWLHGGHYTTGSNQGRTFRNLVEENIVVVALNYRLSIFGFLCLGVPDAPGNAGLKDVIAGLAWIKDNIAAFGGDPNNIVLFGHGSGAAMVDLVTLSPLSNGLVHKAIAQSGSSLSPWAVASDPIKRAREFGEKLSYTGKSNEELASALINTETNLLLTALNDFELTDNSALFAPCLENPNLNSNTTFMTEAPINILSSGNFSKINFLTGYTDREGTLRAAEVIENSWLTKMQANFSQFLQSDLGFDNATIRNETARSIRQFYFSERDINMETIEDYLDYHGDTMILVSVIRGARERSIHSGDLVRVYEFGYIGTLGQPWIYQTIPLTGARHGHELSYLFGSGIQPRNGIVDSTVSRSLIRRWTTFARTGIPIATSEPGNAFWPVFTSADKSILAYGQLAGISGSIENIKANPHQQRMTFWEDIYSKYYQMPKQANSSNMILSYALVIGLCQIVMSFV